MHVVCEWIGNSQAVAAKHYLQVTEEHFSNALQNAVQHPAALACVGLQEDAPPSDDDDVYVFEYARQDSNLRPAD